MYPCKIAYIISSNHNNCNEILSPFSRPEKEGLERSSNWLKAKQGSQNQAGVGATSSPPFAGMWLYLQNERHVYLQDCCRVQPNNVSYK